MAISENNTIYVTNNADSGVGSLRDAINQANLITNNVVKIIIKPLTKNHIKLTSSELKISSNIRLVNQTNKDLKISSNAINQRIFHVLSTSSLLKISSKCDRKIIISGSKIDTNGGAIYVESPAHELILKNVIVINNQAILSGGGIYTLGKVTLISSCIESNKAGVQGAGIYSGSGVVLSKTIITKNNIVIPNESSGGGIFVDDGLVLTPYCEI